MNARECFFFRYFLYTTPEVCLFSKKIHRPSTYFACGGQRIDARGKMCPMKILAFETANDPGSVAFYDDGQVWARQCPVGPSNSESLLPLAESLLREAGVVTGAETSFRDLSALVFGSGPGSFTGLRVGCGVAQGLAMACERPLLGISSLAAMAFLSGGARVIVALDAGMGEVYYGFFEHGELGEVGVYAPEQAPLPSSTDWLACGNGFAVYPALRERLSPWVSAWRPEIMPSAESLLPLAVPRLARGECIDPALAAPFYVRNKVAKTVAERLSEGGKA